MSQEYPASYIVEAAKPESGRPATLIYLHGYSDDAEGLPLGLAQQFQMYERAEYLRWVFPNAPRNPEAATTAWFVPRQLPGGMLPFVPGRVYETDNDDDEEGILRSVDRLDQIVEEELARGVPPERLLVGGFSQGGVISLVWSMVGRNQYKVAGVMPMCTYFPLGHRIETIRKERGIERPAEDKRKWYYVHGDKDQIIPPKMFEIGQDLLSKWIDKDNIESRLHERMGHATSASVLRGMLRFFDKVIPA